MVQGYILVLTALIFSTAEVVNGCTRNFMNLDLLRERAEKIPDGGANTNDGLDGEFRLLHDRTFSCSGTMTGLFFVGAVKQGTLYPEIQLWGFNSPMRYNRLGRRDIILAEGDFSPDGVLRYNLTSPLSFQSGDKLGVYQPDVMGSVVRLYHSEETELTYQLDNNMNPTGVDIRSLNAINNERILVSPISDSPSCTGNFLSLSDLRQGALDVNINGVRRRGARQRLLPDITFTCNGLVTKWIVGGTTDSNQNRFPEVQIWRNTGGNNYTRIGVSRLPAGTLVNNIIEYIPNPPLEFQEGDILGVYQPRNDDSTFVMYNQEYDGPANYNEGTSPLSTVTLDGPDFYDYPLVTPEISIVGPSMLSSPPQGPSMALTNAISIISTTVSSSPSQFTDIFSEFESTLIPSQSSTAISIPQSSLAVSVPQNGLGVSIVSTSSVSLTPSALDPPPTPSVAPATPSTISEIHSTLPERPMPPPSSILSTPATPRPIPRLSLLDSTIIFASTASTGVIILFIALLLIALVIIVIVLRRKSSKRHFQSSASTVIMRNVDDPLEFKQNECYSSYNQSDHNKEQQENQIYAEVGQNALQQNYVYSRSQDQMQENGLYNTSFEHQPLQKENSEGIYAEMHPVVPEQSDEAELKLVNEYYDKSSEHKETDSMHDEEYSYVDLSGLQLSTQLPNQSASLNRHS